MFSVLAKKWWETMRIGSDDWWKTVPSPSTSVYIVSVLCWQTMWTFTLVSHCPASSLYIHIILYLSPFSLCKTQKHGEILLFSSNCYKCINKLIWINYNTCSTQIYHQQHHEASPALIWVSSEWFLNGTSAYYRPFSAMKTWIARK